MILHEKVGERHLAGCHLSRHRGVVKLHLLMEENDIAMHREAVISCPERKESTPTTPS
jgi:hypothetical protein